jgi:hypothetical protein
MAEPDGSVMVPLTVARASWPKHGTAAIKLNAAKANVALAGDFETFMSFSSNLRN